SSRLCPDLPSFPTRRSSDLVEVRQLLDAEALEIQEILEPEIVGSPAAVQRRSVLGEVLPRPKVVVTLQHTDRTVVRLTERTENLRLDVLRVPVDVLGVLTTGVLVPPRRLREVRKVADVHQLVRHVLLDEPDESLHQLPVLVRCLDITHNYDSFRFRHA